MQKHGLISLAIAAAAGFRGVVFNVGNFIDRYTSKPRRTTAQHADGGFLKHPPGTVAQSKRAAVKAKNRAKHRAACRG